MTHPRAPTSQVAELEVQPQSLYYYFLLVSILCTYFMGLKCDHVVNFLAHSKCSVSIIFFSEKYQLFSCIMATTFLFLFCLLFVFLLYDGIPG